MAKKQSKKSGLRSSNFSRLEFVIYIAAFGIIGLFTLWVSLAAPHKSGGGGKYNSTLTLAMVTDKNSDGLPNWGDTIAFNETTTYSDPGGAGPWVTASCTQNGTQVYNYSYGYGPAYPWPDSRNAQLSSQAWTSGAADCTANLVYSSGSGKYPVLATLSFHVNP